MKLIVGLGNPGNEYSGTRHNIGFDIIDSISRTLNVTFSENKKLRSDIATGITYSTKFVLSKPTTFMNLSGQAVSLVSHYYKISTSSIIIIHDDIDLPVGAVKVKSGGGHGGHNGLKSIDNCMGSHYTRVRVGVGRPVHKGDVSNYVLGVFNHGERLLISDVITKITANFAFILEDKIDEFIAKIM